MVVDDDDGIYNISDDFDWIGSELCTPQDHVTDFFDGLTSTNELSLIEDFEDFFRESEEEIKSTPWRDCKLDITKKKPRSKRTLKQCVWSTKDFEFSALENHQKEEFSKRRCSHCQIDNTPQWRIGPLGPKTLCNACGVRYYTGRLLPEYRPAASPTFDQDKHSNFHKQVLQRRGN